KGLVPISGAAIDQAIDLNGVAVSFNKQAFLWGRRAAEDLAAVEKLALPAEAPTSHRVSQTFDELVERRRAYLAAYQDEAYAGRYLEVVERARKAEAERTPGMTGLAEAVARYAYKVMAYKDEYEVARLYSDPEFEAKLRNQFSGDFKLKLHLAPPLLADRDPQTGHLKKREYGPWIFQAFRLLTRLKGLRGTRLDPFGYSAERRAERRLRDDYLALVEEIAANLSPANHAIAVELASVPDQIRGFGHIKDANLARGRARWTDLLESFRDPAAQRSAAE
ncbi:MAG: DUF6537 domain-containing protein, partial [Tistlia sp.]